MGKNWGWSKDWLKRQIDYFKNGVYTLKAQAAINRAVKRKSTICHDFSSRERGTKELS
jgi:hypothetical protein